MDKSHSEEDRKAKWTVRQRERDCDRRKGREGRTAAWGAPGTSLEPKSQRSRSRGKEKEGEGERVERESLPESQSQIRAGKGVSERL